MLIFQQVELFVWFDCESDAPAHEGLSPSTHALLQSGACCMHVSPSQCLPVCDPVNVAVILCSGPAVKIYIMSHTHTYIPHKLYNWKR